MEEYKITMIVKTDESDKLNIKMDVDSNLSAFDFLRVINSLSEITQNRIEKYYDETNEVNSMEEGEKILLNDLLEISDKFKNMS